MSFLINRKEDVLVYNIHNTLEKHLSINIVPV
jgi:hypothetical protein